MKTYTIELIQKREIAQGTYEFVFRKPSDFAYHAGQYVSLCVDKPEIAIPKGTMRELSLVSAPYEDVLTLALRFRDTVAKLGFMELEPGDTAYLQGPFGDYHLRAEDKTVVMLAGGIGIVPFISMLRQTFHQGDNRPFFLFFSNRQHTDMPYLPELAQLAKEYPQLRIINTLTGTPRDDFESGYISPILLKKYLTPISEGAYYISGPQRCVGGMWEVLEEMHIPVSHIHGEEFTGY